MKYGFLLFGCMVAPALAWQSPLKLDYLDRLSAKASETVNVTLDSTLLKLAGRFLDSDADDDAALVKLIAGLNGVVIRSFEFANPGEYADADVEKLRAQLRDAPWRHIVETRSKTDGDADLYLRTDGVKVSGLVVVFAGPKELTVVNIEGIIDPILIRKLSGEFGIPRSAGKVLENDRRIQEKLQEKTQEKAK